MNLVTIARATGGHVVTATSKIFNPEQTAWLETAGLFKLHNDEAATKHLFWTANYNVSLVFTNDASGRLVYVVKSVGHPDSEVTRLPKGDEVAALSKLKAYITDMDDRLERMKRPTKTKNRRTSKR